MKTYIAPKCELIRFAVEDIIAKSPEGSIGGDNEIEKDPL